MKYADTGVNYDALDPFKRACQEAARETAGNIHRLGFRVIPESYGESAFLFAPTTDAPYTLAHVEEGLGTKNLVADAMWQLEKKSYYANVAQCTVAMIVNDPITLGALPISIEMHAAVGKSEWFANGMHVKALVAGWKAACDKSGAAWGGGETPSLKGIISPETILLSGSAVGVIRGKPLTPHIETGDAIIFIRASGIHANGLSLARALSEKLSEGYHTRLSDGRSYGESLLDATPIYVGAIEECMARGIDLHYAVNITGHGWRKLMRAPHDFTYIIETMPPLPPVFEFIQQQARLPDEESFGTLNMGAGFALIVAERDVQKTIDAVETGMRDEQKHGAPWAFLAGRVADGTKSVVIEPKRLVYSAEKLSVR